MVILTDSKYFWKKNVYKARRLYDLQTNKNVFKQL